MGIASLLPELFDQYIHYIIVAFAAGSGGLAHAVAIQSNQTLKSTETRDAPKTDLGASDHC